jgi:hypothetical protein
MRLSRKLMKSISSCLLAAAPACCAQFSLPAVLAQEPVRMAHVAETARARGQRHLIVCVDGVGFSTIEKMRAKGRFGKFQSPARMISPFPSLTNLSLSEILEPAGAKPSAGYEDSYFDLKENSIRGGLVDRFKGGSFIHGTFRELFDYHPSAIKSGLGYALPPVSTYVEAWSDIVRLKQKFRASKAPVFFAYIGSTDSLAHLGGERMLRKFMGQLDDTLTKIVADSDGEVQVTIFSDHGNHFTGYHRVSLKEPLRRAGMKIETRVQDDRSVVFPQYGLIGCALLFTTEDSEPKVADAVANVRGVDFAAYEHDGVVHVTSRGGGATIERQGDRFRYRTTDGDPLQLASVLLQLAAAGRADGQGFISASDWFIATQGDARPDAVRRIYDGATNHVRNRASVVINLEDGYYSGSAFLDVFAILQSTHGSLGREQSTGFLMSTQNELPAYVSADDLWSVIGSPELRKTAEVLERAAK